MIQSPAPREQFWCDLLVRFDARLRAYLRRARWDDRVIAEIIGDVWALAVEREETLANSDDPWPVLREIAVRASARRLPVRRHEVPSPDWLLAAVPADASAESAANEQALARWTKWALAQLSEQQRFAVDYRYRWSWPYWAVAAAIGTTEATARVHVWRGLEKLHRIAVDHPPPKQPQGL